jgi:hypothetical protein
MNRVSFSFTASNVLINEDRIAIGVYDHEISGSGRTFVGFTREFHALCFQLAL